MKKIVMLYTVLIAAFFVYFINYHYGKEAVTSWGEDGLQGDLNETYVMVTFQAGLDYWKTCLKGFEDAAEPLNVSVEYRGSTQYDVQEQIMVLEQVIARKPAGIALTAMDPEALTETINKAVDAGIPVVLFDSGAIGSKAYSFLGTDSYKAGVTAADELAKLLNGKGKVAVVTQPNQQNHEERTQGFRDAIAERYPNMMVVDVLDGKSDQVASRDAALKALIDYPDLAGFFTTEANGGVGVAEAIKYFRPDKKAKIISFDTDKGTLDMIKEGYIDATMAQGTWNMGYWSLQFLFHLNHSANLDSNTPGPQLLPPFVDTGINIVTNDNVDHYYAK